jgi:hypothetical protein
MPPDSSDLERWFAAETEPDDRSICWEVGPGNGFPGSVEANVITACLGQLQGVLGSVAVNGFSFEHVPLPLFIVQRHAIFEAQVAHLFTCRQNFCCSFCPTRSGSGGSMLIHSRVNEMGPNTG